MNSSIFDMLPPELQMLPVIAGAVAAVVGLMLWSAGIKVARGLVAGSMGAVFAGGAFWLLPAVTGFAGVTCGILGLVMGVLLGAVMFRMVQGAALGAVVGLAVAGGFYHWEGMRGGLVEGKPEAATQVAAASLQIPLEALPEGKIAGRVAGARNGVMASGPVLRMLPVDTQRVVIETRQEIGIWWAGIPELIRRRMAVLAVASALAALIVGLMFPRHTTWVATAAGGALLLVTGVLVLLHVYGPQYQRWIPAGAGARWGIVAVVILVGMLMQRSIFWHKRGEQRESEPAEGEGLT